MFLYILAMAQFDSIRSYAVFVRAECPDIPPVDFFRQCNEMFVGIDTSKMNEMLEMFDHQDEFFVNGNKLEEYGVATIRDSSHISQVLRSRKLENGKDYICRSVAGNLSQSGRPNVEYLLTLKAFELCLMGSKNKPVYRKYYVMLKECAYYYDRIARRLPLDENETPIEIAAFSEYEMHQSAQLRRESESLHAHQKCEAEGTKTEWDRLEQQVREIRRESATARDENRKQLDAIKASIEKIAVGIDRLDIDRVSDKKGKRIA
jgi:hypothetical protein